MTNSRIKVDFFSRKSATKLLCVKNVSGKVVRHSLVYLTVHKWLVGDVPLNVNFEHKVNGEPPVAAATVPISASRKSTHTMASRFHI